jgi:hypothetical protein
LLALLAQHGRDLGRGDGLDAPVEERAEPLVGDVPLVLACGVAGRC